MEFPEFGVLGEDAVAGCYGDDESGQAVHESSFEDVSPEEAEQRPEHQVRQLEPAFLAELRPGRDTGELVECCQMTADMGVGIVVQVSLEPSDRSVNGCAVVRLLSSAQAEFFAKEPEFHIRIPVSVGDPSAEVPDHARELEPRNARVRA